MRQDSIERRRSRTHLSRKCLENDSCTPKLIALSPAAGRLLLAERYFAPLPELPDDLAAKYITAYPSDRSGLWAFRDGDETYHGGVSDDRRVHKKYGEHLPLAITVFRHRPCHDSESVFWCMVACLLRAVPLRSPQDDKADSTTRADPILFTHLVVIHGICSSQTFARQ